jgi:Lrp/AsnC family leucine-responsive transcriptional regulator
VRTAVAEIPEVIECHCITGSESYLLKVACSSVPHLEHFLLFMKDYGEVRTSLVLSTQVKGRIIDETIAQADSR